MSERNWFLFVEDIIESIILIEEYIKDLSFESFKTDRKTQDAVIRNLEIIGEALKNIPLEIRENNHEIDWKGFIGLRNIITHQYFGLSLSILWNIINNDLKNLKIKIKLLN